MGRLLYDLAAAEDDRRFSPFCWRIRLAMRHKGLDFDTKPWRFTDKQAIAFSHQDKVPVLVDGSHTLSDSWVIAEYLEETYPLPSLFGGPAGRGMSRFVTDWVDTELLPRMFRLIATDIVERVHERDRAYFRQSREAFLGMPLEDLLPQREAGRSALGQALAPLRRMLSRQPFIDGTAPAWADIAAFSVFQWCRCISPFELLDPGDRVAEWRGRMLDAYDGEGRKVPAY